MRLLERDDSLLVVIDAQRSFADRAREADGAAPSVVATCSVTHRCDSRSSRRPIDRKRQPELRVMPSSTKPDSVIIDVTARSSQLSAKGRAAPRWNTGSAASWFSVRQLSADMRSRRLNAVRESWFGGAN